MAKLILNPNNKEEVGLVLTLEEARLLFHIANRSPSWLANVAKELAGDVGVDDIEKVIWPIYDALGGITF